jgi:UDP-N-acetylglucosamine--N-acetylmuramyl-(pentapeptide) pyrophosphoryl-undecaprenol N-acetylglucosamine transferase
VCCLAWLRRIPVVVHESDAVMGWGTWVVSWFARYICLGTPPAAGSTLAPRVVLTGNPVRPAILQGSRERGLQLTGLSGLRPILFVTGGSQGAEALNRAIIAQLPALLAVCDVVHLTGRGKQSATAHAGYWSAETSGESMGDLYACASLALIRGGAGSLTECARLRLPAMVVPLQGLAQDHQVRNAERAAAQGGVIHLPEVQLDQLTACVRDLLKNAARLQQMKTALEKASFPLAAETIASLLSSLVLPDQKNG